MKEHKEKVCLNLELSFSNCTYSDCTASDRLKVKLNSGVPAECRASITAQVESEFKNGLFSTSVVGLKPWSSIWPHLKLSKKSEDISESLTLKIELCIYIQTKGGFVVVLFLIVSQSEIVL